MTRVNKFDASASMLGYIYQVRYALYLGFKKLLEVDEPDDFNISVEALDDVAFMHANSPIELLQTKFHSKPGNLTDRSADFWKTIRVWVELSREGHIQLNSTVLSLLTTQALGERSICSYLGVGRERDPDRAMALMSEICKETSKANQAGYDAYRTLSPSEKSALADAIHMIGKADDHLGLQVKIKKHCRQSVSPSAVSAFSERLEGAWFGWMVNALSKPQANLISLGRLQDLIDSIRSEYTDHNLPAEFADAFPNVINLDEDARAFVQQLRLFGAPKSMIERAVVDYYRAVCSGLIISYHPVGYNSHR